MGAAESAGAEPDVHVDLVEAFDFSGNDLASFHALKVTTAPVAEVRLKSVCQFVDDLDTCPRPSEALNADLAGLAGVRLVGHARHESCGVLDVQVTPEPRSWGLEDTRSVEIFRQVRGIRVEDSFLLDASESISARNDQLAYLFVGHLLVSL